MKKNFFYKVVAAELMSEILKMSTLERGAWVTQFAIDLVQSDGLLAKTEMAKQLIYESNVYREKQSIHGGKGGAGKHKVGKGSLRVAIPSSSSSNSNTKT